MTRAMARPPNQATDEQLLAERRPGHAGDAFGEFYSRHERRIVAYFLKRTHKPELAADLAAETFAQALESQGGYDSQRGPAVGWLFGIARNVLAGSVRLGRVEDRARRRLGWQPLELDDTTLAAVMELIDDDELLAGLPSEQAEAITARVIDDHTYPDIAAEIGCSEAVVRQRVSRGLRTLRRNLDHKECMNS